MMRLVGPDLLTPARLSEALPAARALLAAAPPGPVVLGTESAGAFTLAAFAAMDTGRTLLPLDPRAPAREVAPLLAGAGLCLLDADPAARWPVPEGTPRRRVDPAARPSAWQRLLGRSPRIDSFPGCLSHLEGVDAVDPVPSQVALLLRTSGTTGRAGLVPWTGAALAAQLDTIADALRLDADARILNLLPLHHYDGLVMGPLLARHLDATLLRVGPRLVEDLAGVLDVAWQERATHLVATPALLSLLLRLGDDVAEVFGGRDFQAIVSTAAPLRPETWRQLERLTGKPVVNVYGLTETGNLAFAGPDDDTRVPGTVGRLRDCDWMLVGEDGDGSPGGRTGELWLRGPSVMTAWPDGTSPLVDGWFRTGDIATVDDAGLLSIVGRCKAMLSVGGLKVAPAEIVEALLAHPAVIDAHVWSEADRIFGERIVAQVVVEPGEDLTDQQLTEWLRQRLSEYKLPRRYERVGRILRGATGKAPVQPAGDVEQRLFAVAARVLRAPIDQLSLGTGPGDVPGWDSLGHLDLIDAIEAEFAIRLEPSDLLGLHSLAVALDLIERRGGGG
ncbi:MAG: hypothetical protein D6798_14885 [Deltaproteobacteria bacterium]|nr:MAG: hypothetical protein D6798_14885 [Deltaproteobacteria bacterium]